MAPAIDLTAAMLTEVGIGTSLKRIDRRPRLSTVMIV